MFEQPTDPRIGNFNISVFRGYDNEKGEPTYAVEIISPNDLAVYKDGWLQATACMLSKTARLTGDGVEKTIEDVTRLCLGYKQMEIPQPPPMPLQIEDEPPFPPNDQGPSPSDIDEGQDNICDGDCDNCIFSD